MNNDLLVSMVIAIGVAMVMMLQTGSAKQSSWTSQMMAALGVTAIAMVILRAFGVEAAFIYAIVVVALLLLRLFIQVRLTKKVTISR